MKNTIERRVATEAIFREQRRVYEPGKQVRWGRLRNGLYVRDHQLKEAKQEEQEVFSLGKLNASQIDTLLTDTIINDDSGQVLDLVKGDLELVVPIYNERSDAMLNYRPRRPVSVTWGAKSKCVIHGVNVNGIYQHRPEKGAILIAGKEPTDADHLDSLVTEGKFPSDYQVFLHEKEHAMQFDIANGRRIPQGLLEVQAYRTKQEAIADFSPDALRNHLVTSGAYPGIDERKVISAIWSIDRLMAMGRNDSEIAKVISEPGNWNEEYGVWEGVEDVVVYDMKMLNMSPTDLEREVMLMDLEDAIVRLQARNTAQALLYGIYEEKLSGVVKI